MIANSDGSVLLSADEASIVARALAAFMRDDSDLAFKNGDVDHESESELLWELHDSLIRLTIVEEDE